ncbi:MAG: D-aminoacyl-tRNA deacylase [Ignavibacteriota bacterium]
MRLLVQRVKRAKVTVSGIISGEIGDGMLLFLGIGSDDTTAVCTKMAQKVSQLRIFEDADGKMNLDVKAISGEILVVSQFTLYADTSRGNRPSFTTAMKPESAKELYEYFTNELITIIGKDRVSNGVFGAMMEVELINDGPVTIWVDSC